MMKPVNLDPTRDEEMAPLTTTGIVSASSVSSPSTTPGASQPQQHEDDIVLVDGLSKADGRHHQRRTTSSSWRGVVYCTLMMAFAVGTCVVLKKEMVSNIRDQSSSYIRKKVNQVWSSSSSTSSSNSSSPSFSTATLTTMNLNSTDMASTVAHGGSQEDQNSDENAADDSDQENEEKDKNQGSQEGGDDYDEPVNDIDKRSGETEQKEDEGPSSSSLSSSDVSTSVVVEPAPSILDHRPNLVLHVGPQKTASSTLQDAWHRPTGLLQLLLDDNYRYEFINPHRGWFDCKVYGGGFHDCVTAQKFYDMLNVASNNNKNLLLSDENLDATYASTLRDAIDDEKFKVTVVVVYRRIHEWLVSWVRFIFNVVVVVSCWFR